MLGRQATRQPPRSCCAPKKRWNRGTNRKQCDFHLPVMDSFAQRIMRLKPVAQADSQPLNDGNFGCQPTVADRPRKAR